MERHEVLHLLHGNNTMMPYVGQVTGNARLGIPDLRFNDGSNGFRDNNPTPPGSPGTSTQFPSLLALGAAWDPELAAVHGEALADEFLGKGANGILGPQLCVHRVPYEGRNFERLGGEDPHLGSALAGPLIKAIQGRGVIANANIFVANSQEKNRTTDSAEVGERTLHEIYLPPFEAAVAAGVGSFMCSYSRGGTVGVGHDRSDVGP
eukprot:gene6165-23557_t